MAASVGVAILTLPAVTPGAVAGPDRIGEARRVLASAPEPGGEFARELHAVLLADVKDHGPPGNGKHDYPLWQRRWALLLGGKGASSDVQANLSGPPNQDPALDLGAPGVKVTMAWQWPSDNDFKTAEVIVAFCYMNWTDERLAQTRRYLEGGGGLVVIHSATWTKPQPSHGVAGVTGVGGFTLFRHGSVQMEIAAPGHPICRGLPSVITLEDDETYWPPTPMMESVTVLATSVEERGARGSTPKAAQPMFWCFELGKGRVFGCVPGHSSATFDDPFFRIFLLRGIAWASGESPYRLDGLVLRGAAANGAGLEDHLGGPAASRADPGVDRTPRPASLPEGGN